MQANEMNVFFKEDEKSDRLINKLILKLLSGVSFRNSNHSTNEINQLYKVQTHWKLQRSNETRWVLPLVKTHRKRFVNLILEKVKQEIMKFEKSTHACMISFAPHRGIKFDSDYDLFVTFLFCFVKNRRIVSILYSCLLLHRTGFHGSYIQKLFSISFFVRSMDAITQ